MVITTARSTFPFQTRQPASPDHLKAHLVRCLNVAFSHEALEVVDEEDLLRS